MKAFDFFEWAEDIAKKLKCVAHGTGHERFFKASGAELTSTMDERLSSLSSTVLIAVDKDELVTDRNFADSLIESHDYALVLCSPTVESKQDSIVTAVHNAASVLQQVRNIAVRDLGSRISKCAMYPSGVIGDNFYGMVLEFTVTSMPNFSVNADYFLPDEPQIP